MVVMTMAEVSFDADYGRFIIGLFTGAGKWVTP
jgi:hypothetical protein